jgi:hypothetical protein
MTSLLAVIVLLSSATLARSAAALWSPICENIDTRLPCSVPDIETEATTGESFGAFIGTETAESIKSFYASPDGCPIFEELHAASKSFRRFISEYMDEHDKAFPTEHAEVVAMAEGAGILVSSVFIQNACSELYLLYGEDVQISETPIPLAPPPIFAPYLYPQNDHDLDMTKHPSTTNSTYLRSKQRRRKDHCSDIGLLYASNDESVDCMSSNYIVQGHNEDWWSGVADKMSVVHTPAWMGYVYPGQLPGTSFVTSSQGLVLTMNSMYPLQPGYTHASSSSGRGVAYVFAYPLRQVISSQSTSEVIRVLSSYPVYSGYSLNVMSACDMSLTNIEGYGDRLGVQSRHGNPNPNSAGNDSTITSRRISGTDRMQACSSDSSGVVGHFNSYVNLAVDESPGKLLASQYSHVMFAVWLYYKSVAWSLQSSKFRTLSV